MAPTPSSSGPGLMAGRRKRPLSAAPTAAPISTAITVCSAPRERAAAGSSSLSAFSCGAWKCDAHAASAGSRKPMA